MILCVGPHLRSLPFAALHDGQKFLIEQYSLALIPGFNLTDWQVSPKPSQVLAMGASTFEDYPPLPSVSEEIRRISPVLWPGDTFLNEDFTVANLQNQLQSSQYSIIHLATHASFNSGSPTQSFIQFSDQALNLSEMEQLDWSAHSVNLLVLSACETALGNQEAELGFVGLAVHLGIKSALGSLWQVSDVGTLTIMDEFYWQLKQAPSKAEALRQAQLAMLKKQILLEGQQWHTPRDSRPLNAELLESQNLDLSHPFFWASFTLIGNPF